MMSNENLKAILINNKLFLLLNFGLSRSLGIQCYQANKIYPLLIGACVTSHQVFILIKGLSAVLDSAMSDFVITLKRLWFLWLYFPSSLMVDTVGISIWHKVFILMFEGDFVSKLNIMYSRVRELTSSLYPKLWIKARPPNHDISNSSLHWTFKQKPTKPEKENQHFSHLSTSAQFN